jgi:hypothetical protein
VNSSEFDPDSIMIYEILGYFTKGSLPTGGRNYKLSEIDELFIAKLDPRVASMPTVMPQLSAEPISTST